MAAWGWCGTRRTPRVEEKETPVFEPDEARRFAAAVAGNRLEALYVVALALGLRQGSCSGSDGRTWTWTAECSMCASSSSAAKAGSSWCR